jgi:hypothetical protein
LGQQPPFLGGGGMGGGNVVEQPPVETYRFEGEDGTEYEGIRNKRTGQLVAQPIPVKAPKGAPAESAGKIAMATNALNYQSQLEALFIKGGKVDRKLLMQMAAPMGGIGEGRLAKSIFRDAVDARIRASTGAAISQEEIPYYESIYLPSILDSDFLVKDKITRFREFIDTYLEAVDPKGTIRSRMAKPGGNLPSDSTPSTPQRRYVFDSATGKLVPK